MSRVEKLRLKLMEGLAAENVEIEDESWKHAGHAAMAASGESEATHLNMIIVSAKFEGLSVIDQHRLVYKCIQEERDAYLHALRLKTLTPEQYSTSAM
ncbi:MAG: BolA family protein [Cyanobacteria bacterium P01_H01_bin.74]